MYLLKTDVENKFNISTSDEYVNFVTYNFTV